MRLSERLGALQYCLLLSASCLGVIADPDSAAFDAAIDLGVHPKTVRAPPWVAHSAKHSGVGQVCHAYDRHLSCSDIGRAIYARARLQAFSDARSADAAIHLGVHLIEVRRLGHGVPVRHGEVGGRDVCCACMQTAALSSSCKSLAVCVLAANTSERVRGCMVWYAGCS